MDTETFIVVASFVVGGAFALSWTPWGRALAERLRGSAHGSGNHPAIPPEVVDRLDQMQQEIGELAERLDFAERLLALAREHGQLPSVEEHHPTPV